MLSMIEVNCLFQHVIEPTRTTETSSNILDLVFSTEPSKVSDIHIVPGVSDHDAVIFRLSCGKKQVVQEKKREKFTYVVKLTSMNSEVN